MKPNEFGDLLAGVFAALAFFWVALGLFVQSKQLDLQRHELELQRNELALQRDETRRLADEAKRQSSAIEANELHARRDAFLRLHEMMDADQQSCASIMLRNLTASHEYETAVHLVEMGDKFGLQTYLATKISAPPHTDHVVGIFRERLAKDKALRSALDRYVENFEHIMLHADYCDGDHAMRRHIEFTPSGTLYATLCLVVERKMKFAIRSEPARFSDI